MRGISSYSSEVRDKVKSSKFFRGGLHSVLYRLFIARSRNLVGHSAVLRVRRDGSAFFGDALCDSEGLSDDEGAGNAALGIRQHRCLADGGVYYIHHKINLSIMMVEGLCKNVPAPAISAKPGSCGPILQLIRLRCTKKDVCKVGKMVSSLLEHHLSR